MSRAVLGAIREIAALARAALANALTASSVLLALIAASCIGPSSSVLDGANVQVLVAGLVGGEQLDLVIGDEERRTTAPNEALLVMYVPVPAGEHAGLLTITGDALSRCAAFRIVLPSDEATDIVAVDARTAPPCTPADAGSPDLDAGTSDAGDLDGGQQDAGEADAGEPDAGDEPDAGPQATLVRIEETVLVVPCVVPPCTLITTVEGDGSVTFVDQSAAPESGNLLDADRDAFNARGLSAEVGALFAGEDPDCIQVPPLQGLVSLRRVHVTAEGTTVDEVADVSVCLTGVASELRARFALARAALP